MKLKFDSNLQYQNEAIESAVKLFDGQSSVMSYFSFPGQQTLDSGHGVGNKLELTTDEILNNLRDVQVFEKLAPSTSLDSRPDFTIEMETGTGKTYVYLKTIFELNKKYGFTKFIIVVPSIAIKEGVYKSLQITQEHFKGLYDNVIYDYFIYDSQKLEQVRNFSVSSNIQIMVINIDAFRKSFTDPSKETKANIIHRPNDKLNGLRPIELIQETNPIVIIDEPQSTSSTAKAQEAIASLNPLCTFQYSATPKDKTNLIYKLDAVDAYEMDLVKQIEVASLETVDSHNDAYLKLVSVDNKKSPITAKIELDAIVKGSVKRKSVKVKKGDVLSSKKLANREIYDNFMIDEIYCEEGNEYVSFANNDTILRIGKAVGDIDDLVLKRQQIHATIEEHLDKELKLNKKGIKVLSLFFIDKVANYRQYDTDGNPVKGIYAQMFEEEYEKLIKKPKYEKLGENILSQEVSKVHNGYFSVDKKGKFKDSKAAGKEKVGKSKDDEDTYSLIMRDKEKLLSFSEPLRFIFSHSALREGWDNPNVFQICTLNETSSTMKKRQEIGRGLRLCVNQDGERIHDKNVNILTIMANESYESFAKGLQQEMEDEEGFKFGIIDKYMFAHLTHTNRKGEVVPIDKQGSLMIYNFFKEKNYIDGKGKVQEALKVAVENNSVEVPERFEDIRDAIVEVAAKPTRSLNIKPARQRREVKVNKQVFLKPEFKEFWDKIKTKTTYHVEYDTEELIANCCVAMEEELDINFPKLLYTKSGIRIDSSGVSTEEELREIVSAQTEDIALPDIITFLQNETYLTRKTLVAILIESGTLYLFKRNPQEYMEAVVKIINRELNKLIIDGIKYTKLEDYYLQEKLEEDELWGYLNENMIESANDKSVYNYVVYDSETEKKFVQRLESDERVVYYVKLPNWFKVNTPIGNYNPDWAIYLKNNDEKKLYFVIETKGNVDEDTLRPSEVAKIKCGKKHFAALDDVKFDVVSSFEMFKDKVVGNSVQQTL